MGQPSKFTPELAAEICAELADGKSLRTVCAGEGMPDRKTVFRWLRENEAFLEMYDRAKKEGADALVDDMQDISDNMRIDHNHKRIMVDTRKWIASKLKPKKYGEKLAVDADGNGGPIVVTWGGTPT